MAAATAVIGGIGLAISAGTTAMSFAQAANQQKNIRNAQAKASEAMQAARNKLEVNYYDQLSVMNYDRERLAGLSSGAQLIEAGRESDRGAAATAGRVQAMQNEQQAAISAEQNKQLIEIERMKAMEDSRLRDINVQLDMGEISGAQQAESDAQTARAAAMAQGFQGLSTMANQAEKMFELYPNTGSNTKEATAGAKIAGGMSKGAGGALDWSKKSTASNFGGDGYSAYNPFNLFPTLENVNQQQSRWNQFNNMNSPSLLNVTQPNYDAINYRQNLPNYVFDYSKLNK